MKKIEMKIKNNGSIVIELNEKIAPMAVKSVIELIKKGSYNNRKIERLEKDFVIQPIFFDEGDFAEMIEPEFLNNRENSSISFVRGTVGMAGDDKNASAGQFFITLDKCERLNGKFTVIGNVVDGFAEIERLENVDTNEFFDEASGCKYHTPSENQIVEFIRAL